MDPEVMYHDENPSLTEGLVGAQFTIIEVAGDWLRITEIDPITDAMNPNDPTSDNPPNFQGTGWVHASKVRVRLADGSDGAHERPDEKSSKTVEPGNWYVAQRRIIGCRGNWAQIHYAGGDDQLVAGWVLSEPNKQAATLRALLAEEAAAH